jgi:hypothetical protein
MICLSYIELYNNQLYDLLAADGGQYLANHESGGGLKIHEHPSRGVYVTGSPSLRTPVSSPEEVSSYDVILPPLFQLKRTRYIYIY